MSSFLPVQLEIQWPTDQAGEKKSEKNVWWCSRSEATCYSWKMEGKHSVNCKCNMPTRDAKIAGSISAANYSLTIVFPNGKRQVEWCMLHVYICRHFKSVCKAVLFRICSLENWFIAAVCAWNLLASCKFVALGASLQLVLTKFSGRFAGGSMTLKDSRVGVSNIILYQS